MIHSGAIVAAGISQGRSRVCNLDFKVSLRWRVSIHGPSSHCGTHACRVNVYKCMQMCTYMYIYGYVIHTNVKNMLCYYLPVELPSIARECLC